MLDVCKASLNDLVLPARCAVQWLAKLYAGIPKSLHPLLCVGGLFERAIVRHEAGFDALELDVSVGFQRLENPLEKQEVVRYASFQLSAVDEVEWLLVHPVIFKVVNFKDAVWRCPSQSFSEA